MVLLEGVTSNHTSVFVGDSGLSRLLDRPAPGYDDLSTGLLSRRSAGERAGVANGSGSGWGRGFTGCDPGGGVHWGHFRDCPPHSQQRRYENE